MPHKGSKFAKWR